MLSQKIFLDTLFVDVQASNENKTMAQEDTYQFWAALASEEEGVGEEMNQTHSEGYEDGPSLTRGRPRGLQSLPEAPARPATSRHLLALAVQADGRGHVRSGLHCLLLLLPSRRSLSSLSTNHQGPSRHRGQVSTPTKRPCGDCRREERSTLGPCCPLAHT